MSDQEIIKLMGYDLMRLKFLNKTIEDNLKNSPLNKREFNQLIYLKRATDLSLKFEYKTLIKRGLNIETVKNWIKLIEDDTV